MSAKRYDVSGLERLQGLMDGPGAAPMGLLINIRLTEIGDGVAVFQGAPGAEHYNPQGTVHGGWASTLLDSALGCAIETKLPAGRSYGTIELKVNFVRPMTEATGQVECRAEVVHSGRRMATSEARLVGADGKLYAHGSCTCMIYEVT